jgi:hypothetical protein
MILLALLLASYVQTVPQNGNITAALQALPGGDATHAGTGQVFITSEATGDIWLMGPNDPNYANPPAGWLKLTGPITIDCIGPHYAAPHGHRVACGLHGTIQISASAHNIDIRNVMFVDYLSTYIRYGIASNGDRTGVGGSSGLKLENVSWNHGGCNGTGPGMDIGSNSFWIWMHDIVASGCVKSIYTIASTSRVNNVATVTTTVPNSIATGDKVTMQNALDSTGAVVTVVDSTHFTYSSPGQNATLNGGQVITAGAASINIDPGPTGAGSGLIIIDNINLNNGGVLFHPGTNGGSLYVRNVSYEGDFTDPDMPPVLITSVKSCTNGCQIVRIENVTVSDNSNPIHRVQVNNGQNVTGAVMLDWVDISTGTP